MDPRRLTAIAATLFVFACGGDVPTGPSATSAPDAAVLAASANAPSVVAKATGAAHRAAGGKPVLLNFSATARANGTVRGSYYYQSVFDHTAIHVDVTCLTVVDNRAWVGGIIAKSTIPALVGSVSYFYATDAGEGAGVTDEVSLIRAADEPGEDLRFCEELPTLLPNREVLHGNVNVSG